MGRDTAAGVLLAVALVAGGTVVSGRATAFVRPGFAVAVLVAAVVLAVVGAASLPARGDDGHARDGHGHHGPGRVGLLLLLPLLLLQVVDPGSLGSTMALGGDNGVARAPSTLVFPPLEGSGTVELTFSEFLGRVFAEDESLVGRPVRLVGRVAGESEGSPRLVRFVIACCAADARPLHVVLDGALGLPPDDAWAQVEGTWDGIMTPGGEAPVVRVASVVEVGEPPLPYEF
jgi:uncharacterized repeat protein (TIGR03943 family)